MVTKECVACLNVYPEDCFYLYRGGRRNSKCKACYTDRVLANKRANRSHYTELEGRRRLQRRGATPDMTPEELKDLRDVYDLASQLRQRGLDVQVDHTDPITSSKVCGLHTPYNLRILPARENWQKSNKFSPYGVDADGYIYELD